METLSDTEVCRFQVQILYGQRQRAALESRFFVSKMCFSFKVIKINEMQ
jgi:hypothetical protein